MQLGSVPGSKAGHGSLPGRPRRPPQPGPGAVRLQPLLALCGPGQAAGPPLRRRGWAAVSGRIVLHLDKGLGWTAPVFVAGCGDCGTELARSTDQAVAERTARRRRCPVCGTRTARRLPGTTSLAADVAVARGGASSPAAGAG